MKQKILVTGSSGTIGTRLCEKLLDAGYDVIGVDYQPNKWSSRVKDISLQINLLNKEEILNKIPKDVDFVIHLAANARVYDLVVDTSKAFDNFKSLYNILEFARLNNVKKFMFASSREVYGNSERLVYKEDEAHVKNCESPYTASKVGGEALVHSYQQCYGVNFIIVRFSNVYGMYDESDRVVPLFVRLCKQGKDLTVFGKEKLLDFTYIDDAVVGVMLCIEKFDTAKNEVYNLAFGEGTSILKVAEMIKDSLGTQNNINVTERRTGEVIRYVADISKAREKLGYNPTVPFVDGLNKSLEWYNR
ncbi:NAD-dependent epimerase/dehydratase family protein [Nanoarchaeota archaeon]